MTTDETRRPGALPLWDVPGWRERFGVEAGISGVAAPGDPPFDLGLWSDAPVGQVMSAWRRFRREFARFPTVVLAHQVHAANVLWHQAPPPGWLVLEGADGHATASRGVLLTVTVADCVPIYLMSPMTGGLALLHAGWRGIAAGVLEQGIALLTERLGTRVEELVMHIGVAISGLRYEVGREVYEAVGFPAPGERGRLDLRSVLAERATRLRVGEVSVSGHCTAGSPDAFYSHRGSGGAPGRMVAWLGWPGGPTG